MSYVVQGYQGVTMVKRAPMYNAETKIRTFVTEYQGTEAAVRGLEGQLSLQGLSYRTDHTGPVWSLFVEDPVQEDIGEDLDRWEIFTESTEKSWFELDSVVSEAQRYDSAVAEGAPSYKSVVESAATSKNNTIESSSWEKAQIIVPHLRAGVTGWQLDLIGLRRTRKMLAYTAQNYRMNLDDGLLIYSTGQLGVPSSVAFGLPITPVNTSTLFTWGWRKRSQRVEIIGSYVEQTVELLFAPWSTSLAYSTSSVNLDWQ